MDISTVKIAFKTITYQYHIRENCYQTHRFENNVVIMVFLLYLNLNLYI